MRRVEEQLEQVVGQVVVPVDVLRGHRPRVFSSAARLPAVPGVPQLLQRAGDQHGHPLAQHGQPAASSSVARYERRSCWPPGQASSRRRVQPPVVRSPVIQASPKPIRPSAPRREKKVSGRTRSSRGPPAPHGSPSGKAQRHRQSAVAARVSPRAIRRVLGRPARRTGPAIRRRTVAGAGGCVRGQAGPSVIPILGADAGGAGDQYPARRLSLRASAPWHRRIGRRLFAFVSPC